MLQQALAGMHTCASRRHPCNHCSEGLAPLQDAEKQQLRRVLDPGKTDRRVKAGNTLLHLLPVKITPRFAHKRLELRVPDQHHLPYHGCAFQRHPVIQASRCGERLVHFLDGRVALIYRLDHATVLQSVPCARLCPEVPIRAKAIVAEGSLAAAFITR